MEATIRKGEAKDAGDIYQLIRELAIYEKAEDKLLVTEAQLLQDGFGEDPQFKTIVAEIDGNVCGMALYYNRYSTWRGKCLYLEDFAVAEAWRSRGLGQLIYDYLLEIAHVEKAALLCWQVLDWNEPAIGFYKKNEAIIEYEWLNCKVEISPKNTQL